MAAWCGSVWVALGRSLIVKLPMKVHSLSRHDAALWLAHWYVGSLHTGLQCSSVSQKGIGCFVEAPSMLVQNTG